MSHMISRSDLCLYQLITLGIFAMSALPGGNASLKSTLHACIWHDTQRAAFD